SRYECRAQTAAGRSLEIVVVSSDHHALLGLQAKRLGRDRVGLGLRLVVMRWLGSEHGVPWQSGPLRHVDDQRDVAVRARGEDEAATQPGQSGNGVGPRVEAMPGAIQVVDLRFTEALDAELDEQTIEAHAVEIVELGPGQLALADAREHGLVETAPGIGELRP